MLQQFMKDKLMMAKILHKPSKHSASKKGYKHNHKLSKGELNHQKYLQRNTNIQNMESLALDKTLNEVIE